MSVSPRVAYFSMECAVRSDLPSYAGGLGVLAGDTMRTAADHDVPLIGVTLAHHHGYFKQRLTPDGRQSEVPAEWRIRDACERLDPGVAVEIDDRSVRIAAWRYPVVGLEGRAAMVLFLDTDLAENNSEDRMLTNDLYGDGPLYRLSQEAVLGIGGVRMLRALEYTDVATFHMNEGHAALLGLELLTERLDERGLTQPSQGDISAIRRQCVFTTHTPVPAGQDRFSRELASRVLGRRRTDLLDAMGAFAAGQLNMTDLALRSSHYVNGVGMKHGEVSTGMYPNYPVSAISNGVHAATWVCAPMQQLFSRHIPPWRRDNLYLRYAVGIPVGEIIGAHAQAKTALLQRVEEQTGVVLNPKVLTIGFARRATGYKRFELLFEDINRLASISQNVGPLQFVFGGKAHPKDDSGRAAIRNVFAAAEALAPRVQVVYIEDYDMEWAQYLVSGVDLWLNTPLRPFEASGTSGMKAALNGVPSLSVLDGWWIEGCLEGVTGWAIGDGENAIPAPHEEANSLYDQLERAIVPLFYGRPLAYGAVMRSAISINGSYYNAQRMLHQYVDNAYSTLPAAVPHRDVKETSSLT